MTSAVTAEGLTKRFKATRALDGLDLTVAEVRRVVDPGRIDFGGGELTDASTVPVETTRREPDDDYGWWTLSPGTEATSRGTVTLLTQPVAGHPDREVRTRVPLQLSGGGLGEPVGRVHRRVQRLDDQPEVLRDRRGERLEVPLGVEDERVGCVFVADGREVRRE